jgi:ribosomal protein S18 acetylase RimI-like enzyme
MKDIQLRYAVENDYETITYFIRAMLQDMHSAGGHSVNSDEIFWKNHQQKVAEWIIDDCHLFLLAQIGNDNAGFLEGRINTLTEVFVHKKDFHISAIYVVPDKRKQGIATSLIKEALRWAAEQGCEEADLNVLIKNNAKGLYEKIGFKVFQHEMRMLIPTR